MSAIITISEVEDYMARTLAAGEVTAACAIVGYVQNDLETWLHRNLTVADHTETDLPVYPNQTFLSLAFTPVNSVASVSIDGQSWTATQGAWGLDRSGIWLFSLASVIWGITLQDISRATVTYNAGLGEPAITAAKFVVLRRAARLIEKRINDESGLDTLSIGRGYASKWLDEGFTTSELDQVRKYKRRIVTKPTWPGEIPANADSSWNSWGNYWRQY